MDADTHKDLGTRFGVTGFPTLKWIPKGSKIDDAEDCNAGRTADELLSFVNGKTGLKKKLKAAGPTNVITLTDTNFDEVALSENNYALVGFFAPWYVLLIAYCYFDFTDLTFRIWGSPLADFYRVCVCFGIS